MTVIQDTFDPGKGPRIKNLNQLSERELRVLVVSGSREAAQELLRRKGHNG